MMVITKINLLLIFFGISSADISTDISKYLIKSNVIDAYIITSDLNTKNIETVVEVTNGKHLYQPNMVYKTNYPAASLAKIITTVAALRTKNKYIYESIPLRGSPHGIAPRQYIPFIGMSKTPYRRKISMEYAFAHSVNPAFAIIGYNIGGVELYNTANLLRFNIPLNNGNISIYNNVSYKELARNACGYTVKTTISPYHANMIANAIGSDGILRELSTFDVGTLLLEHDDLLTIRKYMKATVQYGTAKKGFNKYQQLNIDIGGKTGNLNGDDNRKYTWFTGYAINGNNGIALTVLLINQNNTKTSATKISSYIIKEWAEYGF